VDSRVAATRDQVRQAVSRAWDVVVIGHNLPGFSGLEVLALVREADTDVPVLVVSGCVGEEAAVAAMKAGAHDFILKDNLARLVPAVERELREAAVRRQARRADERLQSTIDLLERTVQGAVQTLAFLAETRDPYTAGHQRRVTELAEAIAGAMGINGGRRHLMLAAGTLHDLGKTAVPTETLTKPGRLTAAEFELIRVHPRTGYEILADGSGYPSGLAASDIRLEARILAVADVVAAMSSHRPYRAALGLDQALGEIATNRGVLYDAEVSDACAALFVDGFSFS
jgi:putative two-component system response regulator